jgi:amino acid transporter
LLFVCQIISFIVAYGIYEESHDIITTLGSLGILTTVIIAVYTYYAIYRERNFRNHHQLIVAEEATKLQKEMLRLKVDLNLAYNKINQLEQQSS